MTAKIAENDARTSQVDQFAVVTARPRLGTWSIVTSRAEGSNKIWSHKLCLAHPPVRRTFVASIVFFAPIMRRDGESPPKLKKYAKFEAACSGQEMLEE